MAGFSSLGTKWRFTVSDGPLGVVYLVEVDGTLFRIAPDRDPSLWRVDKKVGTFPWESINSTQYESPRAAARDLVQLRNNHKLGSLEAAWGRVLQGAKAETRKEVEGNEIRSNFYECSDGLYGLMEAVEKDSVTKRDVPLKAALKNLEKNLHLVQDILTAGYLWD